MDNIAQPTVKTSPFVSTIGDLLNYFGAYSDLISFISGLEAATIVTLSAITKADVFSPKKTYAELGGELLKMSRVQVIAGKEMSYGNIVNRRLAEAGMRADFLSMPRKWGNRIPHSPFVEHKGRLYLETMPFNSLATVWIINLATGPRIVHKSTIEKYLKPLAPSMRQDAAGLDELSGRQVVWRDYRIDRIRQLRAMGGNIIHKIPFSEAISAAIAE